LAFITDMYSPKIVGNDLSESLNLKGGERALNKAIYQARSIKGITHHSDREIQYYSNLYTQILKIKKILVRQKIIATKTQWQKGLSVN
jgi:putative transposase